MVSEWLANKVGDRKWSCFSPNEAPSPPPELAAVPDAGIPPNPKCWDKSLFVLADPSQLFCLIPLSGDIKMSSTI